MISFFISFYRLAKVMIHGIKNDPEFRFLLIFILLLLTSSTVFYTSTENWSIIDALYFSVMTMATIGYGDFVPTTDLSKLFTILFTFLSIGAFVAFAAKVISLSMHQSTERKLNKKKKQLEKKS